MRVIEVGLRAGTMMPVLPRDLVAYRGFDILTEGSRDMSLGTSRFEIRHLEPHLRLPVEPEAFDLFLVASDIANNPTHVLGRLANEAVRALRPNGWLVFVTEVVARTEAASEGVMSAKEFANLMNEATGQRLSLAYVEAIRHPGEDIHRTAVLGFQRMGAPTRW